MSEGNSSTRSIERALDILECFMFGGIELSLMEISNKINLSPSTAHRLIGTLQKGIFAEKPYKQEISSWYFDCSTGEHKYKYFEEGIYPGCISVYGEIKR